MGIEKLLQYSILFYQLTPENSHPILRNRAQKLLDEYHRMSNIMEKARTPMPIRGVVSSMYESQLELLFLRASAQPSGNILVDLMSMR